MIVFLITTHGFSIDQWEVDWELQQMLFTYQLANKTKYYLVLQTYSPSYYKNHNFNSHGMLFVEVVSDVAKIHLRGTTTSQYPRGTTSGKCYRALNRILS